VHNERGVSLIEIMVAMTILSVVLIGLGKLMYHAAQQTQESAVATFSTAAGQRAASYMNGIAWDSISGAAGCTSDSSGQMTYTQCISVTAPSTRTKAITVVITPTGNLTTDPDTIQIFRQRPRAASPF